MMDGSGKLVKYQGVDLLESEFFVIQALEEFTGKIPLLIRNNAVMDRNMPLIRQDNIFGIAIFENHVVELGLYNRNLGNLPQNLGSLRALKVLILTRNRLSSLPDSMKRLSKLNTLSLSQNDFSEIPNVVLRLTHLRILHLDTNNITSIPEDIQLLKDLEVLSVSKNHLTDLPNSLCSMAKLGDLNLMQNKFKSLPECVFHIENLAVFSIDQRFFDMIAERITQPEKLCRLHIRQENSQPLPEKVGKLERFITTCSYFGTSKSDAPQDIDNISGLDGLETEAIYQLEKILGISFIDCSGHGITEILIFGCYVSTLRIRGCNLTDLPECILNFKKLVTLDLSKNRLAKIPDNVFKLTQLTELSMGDNQITEIPSEIKKLKLLKIIRIHSNKLSCFPTCVFQLPNLKELSVGSNAIGSLPEDIGNFTGLRDLHIYDCGLKSLPESIGNLIHLRYLYLGENNLNSLPIGMSRLKELQNLDLHNNQFTNFPINIGNFPQLYDLNLNNNKLSSIPKSLKNSHVRYINVYGNPFDKLTESCKRFLIKRRYAELIPRNILTAKFPFIQEGVFLIANVSRVTRKQYLEFQKLNPTSGKLEFSDRMECIHTSLAKISIEEYKALVENPDSEFKFIQDRLQADRDTRKRNTYLYKTDDEIDGGDEDEFNDDNPFGMTIEDKFFAFKSWVQGIAEAGIDALKLQSDIDKFSQASFPIVLFLARNLIRVDTSFLIQYLNKIEQECRFEGVYHKPSLRANLEIILRAIPPSDIANGGIKRDIASALKFINELDSEFLHDYMQGTFGKNLDNYYNWSKL